MSTGVATHSCATGDDNRCPEPSVAMEAELARQFIEFFKVSDNQSSFGQAIARVRRFEKVLWDDDALHSDRTAVRAPKRIGVS